MAILWLRFCEVQDSREKQRPLAFICMEKDVTRAEIPRFTTLKSVRLLTAHVLH